MLIMALETNNPKIIHKRDKKASRYRKVDSLKMDINANFFFFNRVNTYI